jgi:hypothetical protein
VKRKHVIPALGVGVVSPSTDAELWFTNRSGDEAAATWYDVSGNGNNGTANNAGACLANYYFRGGASGTSTDDMVSTAYAGNVIKAGEAWTVDGWVTRDALELGQVTLWGCRKTTPANGGWVHRENASALSGPLDWDAYNPMYFSLQDVIPNIIGDMWNHIAITWEPDFDPGVKGYCRHYLNGVQTDAQSVQNFADGDIFEIAGSTYNRWTGFIDTVRVYKRALSSGEVYTNYSAGLASHLGGVVVTQNLVSQYLPTGQTTTAWTDTTGGNNMTGDVTAPPIFDGDDYYTIGQPANLEFAGAFTVEAWASQVNDSSQGSERIVSLDGVNGQRSFIMTMRDNTGKAEAYLFSNNVTFTNLQSTSTYTNNNWHHIVVVNYGDGQPFQLWIDGVLEDENSTGGRVMQGYAGKDWEIGRAQVSSSPDYLNGRCNTVRFYSAALTPDQIVQNYKAGLPAHS